MRLTLVQILEVAEDAEIRAEILDNTAPPPVAGRDGVRRIPGLDEVERRVDSLGEAASELRGIAARMIDR